MAKLLKPSHLVSFRLIPLVDRGWGFHPHPSLLPSREKGSDRLRGNLSRWRHRRVGTESLGRDRLRWCTLATPGIGPGRSRPRHACRNLGGVCKWVTHAGGRNRGLAAALESSYSFSGVSATGNCRDDVAWLCVALEDGEPGHARTRCFAWGFTLILTFSPQGRRDLTVCAGTARAFAPVCAPLSRTLDSSLRWNDGCFRLNDAYDQCRAGATAAQWAVVVGLGVCWGGRSGEQRDTTRSIAKCRPETNAPTHYVHSETLHRSRSLNSERYAFG